jgi:hypothetical protein
MSMNEPLRAWFRLPDVHALAEHAAAAPTRAVGIVQRLTGSTGGPGLLWHATDTENNLTSNGFPQWYNRDGSKHTVEPMAWSHVSGRSGLPTLATPTDGYLSLTRHYRDGRKTLLEKIRRARKAGLHWFAIDPNPDTNRTDNRFHFSDHHEQVQPVNAHWVPATVSSEAVAWEYDALVAEEYTVADGVLARFTRPVVEQMEDHLALRAAVSMPGEYPELRFDGNVVVVFWRDTNPDADLVQVERYHPDADGMYHVGAHLWTWLAS